MITLNADQRSASKPSSSVARIKWPVEETGMNSVTPSTMPRMMAIRRIGTSGCGRHTRSEAVAAEAAEPLGRDRRQRCRLDAERLETRRILGRHIVTLEHQPLVAGERRAGQPAKIRERRPEQVRQRNDVGLL